MAKSWPTAATVINKVAVALGLTATRHGDAADPYGLAEPFFVQLCQLLEDVGVELVKAHPWSQLQEDEVLTTVDGVSSYDLPEDYDRFRNATIWNRTTDLPVLGPLDGQEWQAVLAQPTVTTCQHFRIFRGEIHIYPTPTAAEEVAFEYIRNFWVEADADDLARPTRAAPTLGTDILYFDENLLKAALVLAWREASGMDASGAMRKYERALSDAIAGDSPRPVLDMAKGSDFQLLSARNLPITGWGG